MKIAAWLKNVEKGGPWQLVGIVLAIIGIVLPFLLERDSFLSIDILSNTSVVDIHEDIEELEVLYKRTNIKKEQKDLSIVTLKVHYEGKDSILLDYYDTNDPFGIFISEGQIVSKPEVITASNDYLLKQAQVALASFEKLSLPKVVLEPDDYYVLKLLILHNKDVQPEIRPIGKVAGIKKIGLIYAYKERTEPPFWRVAFSGDISVQIARTVLYGVFIFGGLFLSLIPTLTVLRTNRKITKRLRESLIEEFKKSIGKQPSSKLDFLFKSYIRYGWQYLNHINIALLYINKEKIKNALSDTRPPEDVFRDMDAYYQLDGFYEPVKRPRAEDVSERFFPALVHILTKNKLVNLRRGRVSIDKEAVDDLQLLLLFLEKKKATPK